MNDHSKRDSSRLLRRFRTFFRSRSHASRQAQSRALALPPMTRGMQAFSMVLFFAAGVFLTALVLSQREADPLPHGPQTASAPELQTLYQCPMHPEVIESQPGSCPICGMPLVAMKQEASTEPRSARSS